MQQGRRTWRVRRRWLPHRDGVGVRARFRRRTRKERTADRWFDFLDVDPGCLDVDEAVLLVVAIAALALLWFVFPPVILLGLDLLWLAVVFLGGAVGRFVLGRPWRVDAVSDGGERREWRVKGFRGAGQLRDTLQAEFDAGLDPRPDVTA